MRTRPAPAPVTDATPPWTQFAQAGGAMIVVSSLAVLCLTALLAYQPQSTLAGFAVIVSAIIVIGCPVAAYGFLREAHRVHTARR